MSQVFRIYVEKRADFAVEAKEILENVRTQLQLDVENIRVVNRYDVQGVSEEVLLEGIPTILAEPMVDEVYREDYPLNLRSQAFAIEYWPGQYDQRADACEQCFQLLTGSKSVKVRCAKLFVLTGDITEEELVKIQNYIILIGGASYVLVLQCIWSKKIFLFMIGTCRIRKNLKFQRNVNGIACTCRLV